MGTSYTVLEFLISSIVPLKGIFAHHSKSDIEKIERILEKLQIPHLRDRSLQTLSGGERIKVFIARLLLIDPEIYLFDEPGAFLDVEVLSFLARIIEDLKAKGKIIILTSHDLNFLVDVADEFLALKEGRIIFKGKKEKFIENINFIFDAKLKIIKLNREIFIKPDIKEL